MKKLILIFLLCSICSGVSPSITSFTTGQVVPFMEGRTDFQGYSSSSRILENILIYPQGPVIRRPGTRFIGQGGVIKKNIDIITTSWPTTYWADNGTLRWVDENYENEDFLTTVAGTLTLDIAIDGDVIYADSNGVHKIDIDGNSFRNFYVYTSTASQLAFSTGVKITNSQEFVWVTLKHDDFTTSLHKFNRATGVEVFTDGSIAGSHFGIAVDSEDRVYYGSVFVNGSDTDGLNRRDSDGVIDKTFRIPNSLDVVLFHIRDISVDEENGFVYAGGFVTDIVPNPVERYHVFKWKISDESFIAQKQIENSIARTFRILKKGDFLYLAGEIMDWSGTDYSVFKLDLDLDIVAAYDTGFFTGWIHFDDERRLVVAGSVTEENFYVFDDNLDLLETHNVISLDTRFSSESVRVPATLSRSSPIPVLVCIDNHGFETGENVLFEDVGGTIELNGNVYTITVLNGNCFTVDDSNALEFTIWTSGGTVVADEPIIRLIPFEYSTDDSYVLSWGPKSLGFYRTTE